MSSDIATYTGLELAIYTIMAHNKNVNFYIMTMDIEIDNPELCAIRCYKGLVDWQKDKLRTIVRYFDKNSRITFIDAKSFYLKYLDGGPNKYSAFTPYATLRLAADLILPEVDHVLYLDCDVAVTGNISGVYHDYINRDCDYAAWIAKGARDGKGEMISGVMILNLDRIRQSGLLSNARKNYLTNSYVFPDQHAIEDAGKAEPLPFNFGYCEDLEECTELPLVIHFTNRISPKIYENKKNIRTIFFRKYPFLKYADDGIHLLDTINFK